MANKDPKNVKRLIENESREVAKKAYNGGGSYTAGNGIEITDENVINADVKVLEVSNITGLTTEQCEELNVGDVVVKLTSNQKHTYTVSYKEAGVGMCLTYVDASTSETVSYDYVTNAWVYNSTDITPLKNIVPNPILAGTEADLTGLQVGDTKYKVPTGGGSAQHYHKVVLLTENSEYYCFSQALLLDVYIDTPESLTVADIWNYIRGKNTVFVQSDMGTFGTIYYDQCDATDPLFDVGGIDVNGFTGGYEAMQLLSTQVTIGYDEYI